jgi:hypothetical protein
MSLISALGKAGIGGAKASMAGTAGVIGAARIVSKHPVLSTAAAVGGYSLFMRGNPSVQSIPAGPAQSNAMPGSIGSGGGSYDLGASGDLVFALHRLNH